MDEVLILKPPASICRMPHPIPYQGSKRGIANIILSFLPPEIDTLIEPFAGSAAVSIAAAAGNKSKKFHLNDINQPLMALWQEIIYSPKNIANKYQKLWNEQKGQEKEFYNKIRTMFNNTGNPDCFLYLLARCVKASIRYNTIGEFNQSPDNRRVGRHPNNMARDILAVSKYLKGKTLISSKDFREILQIVSINDVIYMDPPYQGTCQGRDQRYFSKVDFTEFVKVLENLNQRKLSYIVSYDGRSERKIYGQLLPNHLKLKRIEILAGRSTQATLLGKNHATYESLYLSQHLLKRLSVTPEMLKEKHQLSFI